MATINIMFQFVVRMRAILILSLCYYEDLTLLSFIHLYKLVGGCCSICIVELLVDPI